MRDEAYAITSKSLLQPNSALKPNNDIWDIDYKSTSDEEDNDSSDEEDYGKLQYPKVKCTPAQIIDLEG